MSEEDRKGMRDDEELLTLIFKLKTTAEYSRSLYMEEKLFSNKDS